MRGFVRSVGVRADGLDGWLKTKTILRGRAAYAGDGEPEPLPVRLPAAEARRMGASVRLALAAAWEAAEGREAPPDRLPSVFACSGGNAEALDRVLAGLDDGDRAVSPSQFALSGHNAAAGLWSVASRSAAPSISVGAFDGSFAGGLLEALWRLAVDGGEVLLVGFDVPPPPPLHPARTVRGRFAAALVLGAEPGPPACSRLDVEAGGDAVESRLGDDALEALRRSNPAARCLPLLRLIATGEPGSVVLPYLTGLSIRVMHAPC
jgi:hypothetical protein